MTFFWQYCIKIHTDLINRNILQIFRKSFLKYTQVNSLVLTYVGHCLVDSIPDFENNIINVFSGQTRNVQHRKLISQKHA